MRKKAMWELHNKQLYNLYSLPNSIRVIKSEDNEMDQHMAYMGR
jgi:hypothetical protein